MDPRVLGALRRVPRERFVPRKLAAQAYEEKALSIGEGQTISQPFIVAAMTQALQLRPTDRVLEVGTGSGYQAAVLGELAREVYTVEILEDLSLRAQGTLRELGYSNIHFRVGDGARGWPEAAPFDAVIAACAPEALPPALIEQLREGGRLVIPVGSTRKTDSEQVLWLYTKTAKGFEAKELMPVRFVPMV